MSNPRPLVDWTNPIEAVRKSDGAVFPVTLKGRDARRLFITNEIPDHYETNEFWNEDGTDFCPCKGWFIRNVAEEVSNAEEVAPPKTLRDEFAMAAIIGCVLESGTAAWFAELAYRIADAMMAERVKGGAA